MCGICGFTDLNNGLSSQSESIIKKMADSILHRGPDSEGFYRSTPDYRIILGVRRLKIIDLETGDQPLFNEDISVVLIFNGEIYNFQELKKELIIKGHKFKTKTDAEVLVHLYEDSGIDCINKLSGMFAFALFDKKLNKLFLARDRYGKKPLYYSEIKGNLIFGSELKAILKYPYISKELNLLALKKYLAYEYIPAPLSIFKGIFKLDAASILEFDLKSKNLKISKYWEPLFLGPSENKISFYDAKAEFYNLLKKAVAKRLISDVPVGVFLSGGIDSGAIACLMADLVAPAKIKTFSIGFEDNSFSESSYSRLIAGHLGASHHEKILTPVILTDILPQITNICDEPFGDASIIPTYLLSNFARKHITVALSGEGADELLMGYPTFPANRYAYYYGRLVPKLLSRSCLKPLFDRLRVNDGNFSFDFKIKQFMKGIIENDIIREQVWLGSFNTREVNAIMLDKNKITEEELFSEAFQLNNISGAKRYLDQVSNYYIHTYLKGDLLHKIDIAAMANSMEVRAPFLDKELGDFICGLPVKYKYHFGNPKYILKKSLNNKLPRKILNRPKKGFGIPVARWFKKELKNSLLTVLDAKRIKKEGIFEYDCIKQIINEHMSNKKDNRKQLWTLFMFENWLEKFLN
ncbi:MAG: asparagine synthase (glutamine-hydrolyzing) [Planctomycetota bacterium]